MFDNKEKKQQRINEKINENFKNKLYGRDLQKGELAINTIKKEINISLTEGQENFLKEQFSRMDIVTLCHCLESTIIGESFINYFKKIDKKNSFNNLFKIEENDFKIALLLHDVGKITTDKELLLSNKEFNDEEKELMKIHSLDSLKTIKLINDEVNPNTTISEIFNNKITDIATYHHPEYLESEYFKIGLAPYNKLANIVDIIEAMSSEHRYYKAPSTIENISNILKRNILTFCKKSELENFNIFSNNMQSKMSNHSENILELSNNKRKNIQDAFNVLLKTEKILADKFNESLDNEKQLIKDVVKLDEEIENNLISINTLNVK